MIDFRHQTFLALSEIKNYTKTAEYLHITQPAVTQHIKYLEEKYKCKLYNYINKKLEITPQGEHLRKLLMRVMADINHFERNLERKVFLTNHLYFGATLSIGEYVMPKIIANLLEKNPSININMEVNNTESLLKKLWLGEIDIAIVEGIFDKSKYHSMLFSVEKFIPICASNSDFAKKEVVFNEIISSPLIIREKGSGTREILENMLKQYNYSLDSFNKIIKIGNMSAIKELVAKNTGITFLYEKVVEKEIEQGYLTKIDLSGIDITREFNFVFLKDSFYESIYIEYFHMMKQIYNYINNI